MMEGADSRRRDVIFIYYVDACCTRCANTSLSAITLLYSKICQPHSLTTHACMRSVVVSAPSLSKRKYQQMLYIRTKYTIYFVQSLTVYTWYSLYSYISRLNQHRVCVVFTLHDIYYSCSTRRYFCLLYLVV